jgi:hypothetical protein
MPIIRKEEEHYSECVAYISAICPHLGPMSDNDIQCSINALDKLQMQINVGSANTSPHIVSGPIVRIAALPPLPTFHPNEPFGLFFEIIDSENDF